MAVITLTACSGDGGGATDPVASPAGTEATVTWIDDGDTIEVEYTDGSTATIRLIATNAPDQGECYADAALDHLIDTLKGQSVTIEAFGEDQFDRTLAHVFDGERQINVEMVGMGLSMASTPGEDDPYGSAILAAEEDAYNERIGLWSATACGSHQLPEIDFVPGSSVTDPPGPDDEVLDTEAVAIRNLGSEDVRLASWIIRDESTRHRFTFENLVIGPGETFVVNSADPGWDPGDGSVWNNDGDMAVLQLPDGTVVARWRY